MAKKAYVAVDMGASSGRHVVGQFDGQQLRLQEVYRFENGPVDLAGSLYWDLPALWSHVRRGLSAAAAAGDRQSIVSVGVDTWGVDFGLLARGDQLLGNPLHYRDSRTNGMMEKAFAIVSRPEVFRHTGLQFMQFNTLYQLLAMKLAHSPLLEAAETLLLMPDLMHWLLTGVKSNEMTNASTTQFFDPVRGDWSCELLERFDLPTRILGPIVPPGTRLGPLRTAVAAEAGLTAQVVLPGTHDTASAVMAVPAHSRPGVRPDWCYISLGTWALMGIESPRPVVNDKVLQLNFTNEGGVGNTTRLLKNISGLWLVQECRRAWNQAGRDWGWEDLNRLTASAAPLVSFINPDAAEFLAPDNMPEAIRGFCRRTGQAVPGDEGAVLRCASDSLAMKFRHVLAMCEELAGGRIETVHVVGGGTKNRLLCQAAADACGRRVLAGPVEATAIGNLMVQAIADGSVASIAEARDVIRASFEVQQYLPQNMAAWDDAYARFQKVLS
ncbi:MAG: rhamnulokinase family protein [Thermoguttaceae bacterium]|jgi:rhamnulokinase